MYLFVALVVTIVVIALAWRGLDGRADSESTAPRPPLQRREPRQLAPDDDPEFLSEIDRRLRGEDKNGSGGSGAS